LRRHPALHAFPTRRSSDLFEVMPSAVDEPTGFTDPRREVQTVSWLKAAAVAPRIDEGIVIAADTIGWVDGGAVLKPTDEADARRDRKSTRLNSSHEWISYA